MIQRPDRNGTSPYQEVNAGRFKMPSDPGGFWALEKSADPANVLNFVRNDGAGDTIPYTLNPTGTPTAVTDLATKAYVDSAGGGITIVPTPVQNEITIWDGADSIKGNPKFKIGSNTFARSELIFDGRFELGDSLDNNSLFIGFNAGLRNETGVDNTAVGQDAGQGDSSSPNYKECTFVGAAAGRLANR